jgi:hypothetical protein
MNAIQTSEAGKLNRLREARVSQVLELRELKNISWLATPRLNQLAGALSLIRVERALRRGGPG